MSPNSVEVDRPIVVDRTILEWKRKDISDPGTRRASIGLWVLLIAFEVGFELWRPKPWTGDRAFREAVQILPVLYLLSLVFRNQATRLSGSGIFGDRWGFIPWNEISRAELRPHCLKIRRRGRFFSRPFFFLPTEEAQRTEAVRIVVSHLPEEVIHERNR